MRFSPHQDYVSSLLWIEAELVVFAFFSARKGTRKLTKRNDRSWIKRHFVACFNPRTLYEGLPCLELLKITRSVVFQELPKSRYVEGVSRQDVTQNGHHHEYDDEVEVQLPYASTNKRHRHVKVDLIDTRPTSIHSEFDS